MPKEIARINKLQDLKSLPKMSRREPAKPEAEVTLPEGLNGEALFRWAMQDVRPIPRVEPPARKPRITVRPQEDPFEEIFITGQWQWIYNLEADHIEAAHPSVSHLILKKLRRGQFSVRAECDLHGMTQKEARDALVQFVEEAARQRLGCVRVIHGKGNNSWDKVPVLKTRLQEWLFCRRLARYVLAYSSARPCDGGTGAIYVLLRKA